MEKASNNITKYEQVIKKIFNSSDEINYFGLSFPETFSNFSNTIMCQFHVILKVMWQRLVAISNSDNIVAVIDLV